MSATHENQEQKNDDEKKTDQKIGDEEARMISEVLVSNTTLTSLNLEGDENEVKWKQPNK